MFGLAVIHSPLDAEPVAVWLTSCQADQISHANAIVFDTGTDASLTVEGMVRRRLVFKTPATPADAPILRGLGTALVTESSFAQAVVELADRLEKEFEAEQRQRHADRQSARVEPRWPPMPPAYAPPADTDHLAALHLADHLGQLWSAWIQLESLRVARPCLAGEDGEARLLPLTLADSINTELSARGVRAAA